MFNQSTFKNFKNSLLFCTCSVPMEVIGKYMLEYSLKMIFHSIIRDF